MGETMGGHYLGRGFVAGLSDEVEFEQNGIRKGFR